MNEKILKGIPLSTGVAIGKPLFLRRDAHYTEELSIISSEVEDEIERFRSALFKSRQDVKKLQKQLEAEASLEGVLILEAELEMLRDPLITLQIEEQIRATQQNATFVFQQTIHQLQKKFQLIEEPYFADRFNDFQDLARRVLHYLNESAVDHFSPFP